MDTVRIDLGERGLKDFKRINDPAGTSGWGVCVKASYAELRAILGPPILDKITDVYKSKGDGKVSTEWILSRLDEDFTIYDYKATSLYDPRLPSVGDFRSLDSYNAWCIGACTKASAEWFKVKLEVALEALYNKMTNGCPTCDACDVEETVEVRTIGYDLAYVCTACQKGWCIEVVGGVEGTVSGSMRDRVRYTIPSDEVQAFCNGKCASYRSMTRRVSRAGALCFVCRECGWSTDVPQMKIADSIEKMSLSSTTELATAVKMLVDRNEEMRWRVAEVERLKESMVKRSELKKDPGPPPTRFSYLMLDDEEEK